MNDLEIYEFFKESGIYEEESIYEDPEKFFGINYMKECSDTLLEAKGATKSNVLQKLWNTIKKAFSFIANALSKLIKWIKGIIFGKRNMKSADQIAIDSGLHFSSSSISDIPVSSVKGIDSLVNNVFNDDPFNDPSGKSSTNAGNNKSVVIEIPADEESELQLPPIELAIKDLLVKYDSDKNSITFTLDSIEKRLIDDYNSTSAPEKHGKVIGQASIRSNYMYAFRMIRDKAKTDQFVQIVKSICEYMKGNKNIDITKSSTIFNEIDKYAAAKKYDEREIRINYDDFEFFSKSIMTVNHLLSDANILDGLPQTKEHGIYGDIIGDSYDSKLISLVNKVASFAFQLQMGVNAITSTIQKSFILDSRFANCCADLETLDTFVNECIMAGLPPKYIAYNIWIIMQDSLKGNADQNKPVWGQTRIVFFPNADKNSVYKVAVNTSGVVANKTERNVTLKVLNKDPNLGSVNPEKIFDYIAKATAITKNGTVLTMERGVGKLKNPMLISDMKNKLHDENHLGNANFILKDLHTGNVQKMPDGKHKFVDYGVAEIIKANKSL